MDKMSSAHVYVRLHKGQSMDDISEGLLEDCAQLVKANSIQGKSKTLCVLVCFIIKLYQTVKMGRRSNVGSCCWVLCKATSLKSHKECSRMFYGYRVLVHVEEKGLKQEKKLGN